MRYQSLGVLLVNGATVSRPQQARLLAVLLANANRPVSVDLLDDVLADGRAMLTTGALHTAMSRLRSVVLQGSLVRLDGAYRLSVGDGEHDVDRFAELIASSDSSTASRALSQLDDALALWRGRPFGAHAEIPAVIAEVARLTDLHALAHERRVGLLLTLGRPGEAAASSELPLADHPFHEGLHRLRVQALADAGRRVEALRAARDFHVFLRNETGLDPSPALRALEQSLLDSSATAATTAKATTATTATIGAAPPTLAITTAVPDGPRRKERAALAAMLASAISGHPVTVVVEGDAGIGKSTLMRDLADVARTAGARVVRGTSSPHVRLPLLAWSALEGDEEEDEGRPGGSDRLAPGDGASRRPGRIDAVVAAVRRAAQEAPLLVILEDCHWADALTLDALAAVVLTSAPPLRLMVAATTRPAGFDQQTSPVLARLVRDGFVDRIPIGPMDLAELGVVVTGELGSAPSRPLLLALAEASASNPLIACVTARQLVRSGAIVAGPDGLIATGSIETALPVDVQAPYASTIDALPGDSAELVRTLAILGDRVELDVLARSLGWSPKAVLVALGPAEDLALLRLVGERVQFDHDLARRSVLMTLGGSRRQLRHAQVADALRAEMPDPAAASPAQLELVATQLERAGILASAESVASWSLAAGDSAFGATLWSDAARHFDAVGHRVRMGGLDLRIGQARYYALDPSARQAFRRAADEARSMQDPERELAAVLGLHRQSVNLRTDVDEATALLLQLLESPVGRDRLRRVRVLAQLVEFAPEIQPGDQRTHDWIQEAAALVRSDDPLSVRSALHFATGIAAMDALHLAEARTAFRAAGDLGDPASPGEPRTREAMVELVLGDPERGRQLVSASLEEELRRKQYWSELAELLATRSSCEAAAGAVDAAIVTAGDAIRWATLTGNGNARTQASATLVWAMRRHGTTVDIAESSGGLRLLELLIRAERSSALVEGVTMATSVLARGIALGMRSLFIIACLSELVIEASSVPTPLPAAGPPGSSIHVSELCARFHELVEACGQRGARTMGALPIRLEELESRLRDAQERCVP